MGAIVIDDKAKVRLYVAGDLAGGAALDLGGDQAHYLIHVMRMKPGAPVILFNGRDGEWRARIDSVGRGRCALVVRERLRAQTPEPDLWLVFAPIKRARLDHMAATATELGVSALCPVFTRYTSVSRVNTARLRANAIEAAELSRRLNLPEIREPVALAAALDEWPAKRRILMCDETGRGAPIAAFLATLAPDTAAPWAVLTGPEGGFAPSELDALGKLDFVTPVSLGPRVMRADTAALSALACWQAWVGEWRSDR